MIFLRAAQLAIGRPVSRWGSSDLRGGVQRLWQTIKDRAHKQALDSCTASLIAKGIDAVARKIIEESGELVLAARSHETGNEPARVIEEAVDLTYRLLVYSPNTESISTTSKQNSTTVAEPTNTPTPHLTIRTIGDHPRLGNHYFWRTQHSLASADSAHICAVVCPRVNVAR